MKQPFYIYGASSSILTPQPKEKSSNFSVKVLINYKFWRQPRTIIIIKKKKEKLTCKENYDHGGQGQQQKLQSL